MTMIQVPKKNVFIMLMACGLFLKAQAQNNIGFDSLKIYPIPNVDWRKDNSASMDVFKNILRRCDIVMLAESLHLDGTVYDAQCMLMKELINAGAINTVYTESSAINIDRINGILKSEGEAGIKKAKTFFGSAELSTWGENGFWDFLAGKIIAGKVNLQGIDIETTTDTLMHEMVQDAERLPSVKSWSIQFSEEKKKVISDFLDIRTWFTNASYSEEQYTVQNHFIDILTNEYKTQNDTVRLTQWKAISRYLYWRRKRCIAAQGNNFNEMMETDVGITRYFSIRDSMMAENLLDHYRKNTGVKAIVITTTYHTQRNSSEYIKNHIDTNAYFLGDMLHKTLGNKMYSICFPTSSGKYGRKVFYINDIRNVEKPKKGSFEFYFKDSPHDFFFTDWRDENSMQGAFPMKILFEKYITAEWSKMFDGAFFIKKMYPWSIEPGK